MRHAPSTSGWTKKQDERLCAMRKAGATYVEIAKVLGRGVTSCRSRFYTTNLKPADGFRSRRPLGPPLESDEIKRPDDEAFVAKCIAGGGFPGLKLKPGRVFAYVNGQRIEVML